MEKITIDSAALAPLKEQLNIAIQTVLTHYKASDTVTIGMSLGITDEIDPETNASVLKAAWKITRNVKAKTAKLEGLLTDKIEIVKKADGVYAVDTID